VPVRLPKSTWLVLLVLLLFMAAGLYLAVLIGKAGVSPGLFTLDRLGSSVQAYPTSQSPTDFYNRVFIKTRIEQISGRTVETAAEASSLVGFPVRVPTWLPEGMLPIREIGVALNHSYQVEVNLDEARRLLVAAGLPLDSLPTEVGPLSFTVQIGPGVGMQIVEAKRWFTLLESQDPVILSAQNGVEPTGGTTVLASLEKLGLQYLGLPAEFAEQISKEMNGAAFLVLPPADLDSAEPAQIGGNPGYVLHATRSDREDQAVLWANDGVLYGLYGNLPLDQLLKIAGSLK
jgi:hypothetical protein